MVGLITIWLFYFLQDYLSDLQPPEMTEFERVTEKLEFERAGSLYKPLSAEISSRFVSAQSHDISNQGKNIFRTSNSKYLDLTIFLTFSTEL